MATDMPQSLKKGTSPATTAVFYDILVANGAPTTGTDGLTLGMTARVDVVLQESAGGKFDAKVWWFYSDAGVWVEDLAIGTIPCDANSTAGSLTVPGSASKIYLEALHFVGGASARGWIIGRGSINGRF